MDREGGVGNGERLFLKKRRSETKQGRAHCTGFFQQFGEVEALGFVLGVLPVDVEAVEAKVHDQLDGGLGECLAASWGGRGEGEVGGVGPSADGEEDFEVAVAFLEEVQLFYAAVDVGTGVVPGVGWVVLFI